MGRAPGRALVFNRISSCGVLPRLRAVMATWPARTATALGAKAKLRIVTVVPDREPFECFAVATAPPPHPDAATRRVATHAKRRGERSDRGESTQLMLSGG